MFVGKLSSTLDCAYVRTERKRTFPSEYDHLPSLHRGLMMEKTMTHPNIPLHDLKVETAPIASLKPSARNARRHSKSQVKQIAASFEEFGVINPIIVDEANIILAGHGRLEAAKTTGIAELPVVRVTGLTEGQKRAYRIADNRIAEQAEWNFAILAEELKTLSEAEFDIDITVTGFETGAIDVMIGEHANAPAEDEADHQPDIDPDRPVITKPGDTWQLGTHTLLCACSLDIENYKRLLSGKPADMVFTDPPYNVPVDRFVCGLGSVSHEEFAMASGEMTPNEFRAFLVQTATNLVDATRDGAIHFICMDWRHIEDLLAAGRDAGTELKAICVWNKTNGGMGSLYRSKHGSCQVSQVEAIFWTILHLVGSENLREISSHVCREKSD